MAIYCFSGSGNSFFIAKNIADDLNVGLMNVMHVYENEIIIDNDEYIGIVFPTYDFKPPQPVKDLINKIQANEKAYVFLVSTYGVGTLGLLDNIKTDLKSSLKINASYSILMPHNGVGSARLTVRDLIRINAEALNMLEQVIEAIHNRVKLDLMTTTKVEFLRNEYFRKMLPPILGFIKELVVSGADSMKFEASGACIGCQTCAKVCPTQNIEMNNKRPSWGDNCLTCFACVNWCPEHAVSFGGNMIGISPYTHPKVSAAEFIRFNLGDK